MCDICVIQRMGNSSSCRLLLLHIEVSFGDISCYYVEAGINAILLHYTDCFHFAFIWSPEKSINKLLPLALFPLSIRLRNV
jgi:hypothetical protein